MGTKYSELIQEYAGGVLGGRTLLGFAPSGPSSGYLPASMGPNNARVELGCDDCHRTATGPDGWPYAATFDASQVSDSVPQGLKPASLVAGGGAAEAAPFPLRQRYMAPVTFSQNCAACHTLQFDKRFGNEQVPHEKPEVVHAFLLKRFGEYIATHPQAVHEVNPPDRQIPERIRVPRVARNATEWVQFRTDDAEWLLWSKTCKQCHSLSPDGGPLPVVAKSNLTARWLSHADRTGATRLPVTVPSIPRV